MEVNKDVGFLAHELNEEYLEYYVKKYLQDYEESTSDTSDTSDVSFMDWDFEKTGKKLY